MPKLHERRLGNFLAEVANWRYDEFSRAENDEINYTTADAIVFSLVRACVMENLAAIKLAINRIDGRLVTPVQIVYPKVFFVYPLATGVAPEPKDQVLLEEPEPTTALVPVALEDATLLPTLGLRQTLDKMVDYQRSIPRQIIAAALKVDLFVAGKGAEPPVGDIPLVKSVIAAHLISMAQNRNVDSLYEVFDSLDGKLVETIEIVGEDIYLSQYNKVAPFGSTLNDDGVYEIEASKTRDLWRTKLGGGEDGN